MNLSLGDTWCLWYFALLIWKQESTAMTSPFQCLLSLCVQFTRGSCKICSQTLRNDLPSNFQKANMTFSGKERESVQTKMCYPKWQNFLFWYWQLMHHAENSYKNKYLRFYLMNSCSDATQASMLHNKTDVLSY